MISDRRIYTGQDGTTLHEFGDPKAANLLVCEGGDISPEHIEKFGIRFEDERVVWDEPEAKPAPKKAKPSSSVPGLSEERVTALKAAGLDSLDKLAAATDEALLAVEGMTAEDVAAIRKAAEGARS